MTKCESKFRVLRGWTRISGKYIDNIIISIPQTSGTWLMLCMVIIIVLRRITRVCHHPQDKSARVLKTNCAQTDINEAGGLLSVPPPSNAHFQTRMRTNGEVNRFLTQK